MTLRFLLQRDDVVVVDKPAGVNVIPGRDEAPGADVKARVAAQLRQQVWTVHRLDRDTTGVLVFALNARAHRALSIAFEAGEVEKTYLAVVAGVPPHDEWETDVALIAGRKGRVRAARADELGKPSLTHFKVLERFAAASLIECHPRTGRTHQIRVHLSVAGFPLLVDPRYRFDVPAEGSVGGLSRTPLHAASLRFAGGADCAGLTVECALPPDMEGALKKLRASGPGRAL